MTALGEIFIPPSLTSPIDIEAVRNANPLPAIVGAQLKLKRAGNEWKGCCPFHADRSASFTIFKGGHRFYCFGCGASGDVLDYVSRIYGLNLIEAAKFLCAGDLPRVECPTPVYAHKPDRTDEALAIWESAYPVLGTLAEIYLCYRGILAPFPLDLRFQRLPYGNLDLMPCLVAAVRNEFGALSGIQRIYLRDDGLGKASVPKPKLSLGKVAGGAIRLGELDGSGCLTVCEGPEDGLSLLAGGLGPVWVAAGASILPAMRFPSEVHTITIAADNDDAGDAAATKAATSFEERGLLVQIIRPSAGFKDFNDEWRGV
jgi:DNA primase